MEDFMEINNLKYFLAVAREEKMSKAAEQLHVSQPTLSKTLKALEEELGKKLFIRHSFSISLSRSFTLHHFYIGFYITYIKIYELRNSRSLANIGCHRLLYFC